MATLTKLPKWSEIPAQGSPLGLTLLQPLTPSGDRGLIFVLHQEGGIPLGKIPGYWTCPYNGTITAVYLVTDQGGYTINIWKSPLGRAPVASDSIVLDGYSIAPPYTQRLIHDLGKFTHLDVLAGDTFAVEITAVNDVVPTDISGNVVFLKTEKET